MKKNYFLFLILSLFIAFSSCRQEDIFINSNNENKRASLNYKKFNEIKGLVNTVNKLSKSQTGKNGNLLHIDSSAVVIEMNLLDGRNAYSIVLQNHLLDTAYTVKNLHILTDGVETSFLVSEYIPDNGAPFYNLKNFKGRVVYSDVKGNKLRTVYSEDFIKTDVNNKQIMDYIPTQLGCYSYVIAVWSDGSATIFSSVNNCGGGSTGSGGDSGGGYPGAGSSGGGDYGDWDSGNTGGGGSSTGTSLPAMPNIPSEDYVEQKRFEGFYKTLNELQKEYLLSDDETTSLFFHYLNEHNFNAESSTFSKWGLNFLLLNPNVNSYEFKKLFLDNIPVNFHQQLLLEDPSQILNVETLISPNFKMRRLDQIKYPRFTQMVKGLKDYVQNNPPILNKLMEISGMSQAQILDKLTFGKGPQIELIPGLLYVYNNQATPVYGKFSHNSPEVLKINENYVLGLQQASLQSTIEATHFLLAVTVLHEFVHYGNFLTGFNPQGDESGNLFENSVYGVIITKYNAHEYIISINKK